MKNLGFRKHLSEYSKGEDAKNTTAAAKKREAATQKNPVKTRRTKATQDWICPECGGAYSTSKRMVNGFNV